MAETGTQEINLGGWHSRRAVAHRRHRASWRATTTASEQPTARTASTGYPNEGVWANHRERRRWCNTHWLYSRLQLLGPDYAWPFRQSLRAIEINPLFAAAGHELVTALTHLMQLPMHRCSSPDEDPTLQSFEGGGRRAQEQVPARVSSRSARSSTDLRPGASRSTSAKLVSSLSSVHRCVGWKVSTNAHTVVYQSGCWDWRPGIVVDCWRRDCVRRSRSGSDYPYNLQLRAGDGSAQHGVTGSCRTIQRIAGGAGLAA
jgi:hypothetical protein